MLSQKWKCGRCHLLLGYRRYRSGLIGTSDYSPGNFQGRITKPIQRVACVFWSPMGRPIYIRCKSIIYTSWWRVFPFFFFFSFHVLVCCLAGLLCLRFWLLFSCCLPWIMRSSWTHVSIQTTMVLFFFCSSSFLVRLLDPAAFALLALFRLMTGQWGHTSLASRTTVQEVGPHTVKTLHKKFKSK